MHRFLYLSLSTSLLLTSFLVAVTWSAAGAAVGFQQSESHTVTIDAVERSWIEATVDGEQVTYGIVPAGESRTYEGRTIVVLIGNAGGVEVTADNAFLGTLGQPRQVVTLRWPQDRGLYEVQQEETEASDESEGGTVTATPTSSPTATATTSPTATRTPSPSSTPTATPTATSTRSPASTATPLRPSPSAPLLFPGAEATATATSSTTDAPSRQPTATLTATVTETTAITGSAPITPVSKLEEPVVHVVQPGETLGQIALEYEADVETIRLANGITDPDVISVGWRLVIPAADGRLPENVEPVVPTVEARRTITERMTITAQQAGPESPFYGRTWLTYYGRPNVPIMGILGEYDVDELAERLQVEAAAYDAANGPLDVQPAFHLVYGMATKAVGDGSHLGFMDDEMVMTYISKAKELDWTVILDVQIGALTPARAISNALPYLVHENVHLAIDPEFAMVHPGQFWPGNPIGFVTAEQVNETQAVIQQYMEENDIPGPRVLLVHQFQDNMIVNKEDLDWTGYDRVELVLSVDGWGGPWGKISKYNALTNEEMGFTAFKLFYRWDEPLMTPAQALGVEKYPNAGFIEITPSLIIYQ